MSKSEEQRHRPTKMVDKYGADTVRLFMMFASPADMTWNGKSGVEGANRFLSVFGNWFTRSAKGAAESVIASALSGDQALRRDIHKTIAESNGRYRPSPNIQHCHRCDHGTDEQAGKRHRSRYKIAQALSKR